MSALGLGRKLSNKFRPPADSLTERDQRVVWRIAALLLDYPNEQTLNMVDDLCAAAATVPGRAGTDLVSFMDHLRSTPPLELAEHFVATFDMRRRSSLHLTYYAYGDTRKRGMALLRFKTAYRNGGVTLGEHELPDYLPVVLEFAATTDPARGWRLLVEHRAVVELLRLSLHDDGSPYACVLDAVCATLPELNTTDRQQVAVLAAEGPPEEEVGLEPYAMDPALQPELGERR